MQTGDFLDIDRVAFIGRTFFEYKRMFALDEMVLRNGPVLDCAAGPSSFTAEAHGSGFQVTACDLLYRLPGQALTDKGKKDIEHVFDKLDEVRHLYTWAYYKNKEEIIGLRHKSLNSFSADFPGGLVEGRYVYADLPHLPFPDKAFPLVLSSHFLFLYGDRLSMDFHKACLKEMARVCSGEVRIFPLQGLDAKPYPHLGEVLAFLAEQDIGGEIVQVPFEFQKGSHKMMKLFIGK
jgi:hypothetical protein